MNESRAPIIIVVVLALAGAGGFYWWRTHQTVPAPPPAPVVTAPPPDAARPPPAVPDAGHVVKNPLETTSREPPPTLDDADAWIQHALTRALGRKAVLTFLYLEDFVNHFVTTVDNLGGGHAPARLWPVKATPGNFETEARGDGTVISGANAARYRPFVHFVDGIDSRKMVALYIRLYPLFQKAYEELGNPDRYFNDRVVEVIDGLVATPAVPGPIKVKLIEPEPGARRTRNLYAYADPALENLTAGQKILLRMGPENASRLKAKLIEVRHRIARASTAPR
jgi:hypothetical protein